MPYFVHNSGLKPTKISKYPARSPWEFSGLKPTIFTFTAYYILLQFIFSRLFKFYEFILLHLYYLIKSNPEDYT